MNISHEVFTKDAAYQVSSLDGKLSKDPALYASSNCFSYYVAINSWYYIVKECDEWAASALLDLISRQGLLETIRQCNDDADLLVKGEEPISDIGLLFTNITSCFSRSYFGQDPEKNFSRDALASCLQLLRYLRRFSPNNNDWVKEEGLTSFLRNENYVKQKQRREYPYWLISAISDEIDDIIDWESIAKEISNMTPYDFKIPSGATYEGYTSPYDKVFAIFSSHPEAAYQPFGLPYIYPYYISDGDEGCSRVNAVPKSYKATRIIAMEPVYRQARAQYILDIICKYLPDCIDITDQGRNQVLAWEGSRDGRYATLDASNASDLISKSLFRSVIPNYIVELIDPYFSKYTNVNGRKRPMQMMSTAGNSLTFVFETLIYYGIAAAACRYCSLFTGEVYYTSVYGDDVVISSNAARTAIEFYSLLGLRINESKSFLEGKYRESCGEEFYDGINVSSTYFPRFPVIGEFTKSKSINLGVRMYRDSYRGKIDDSTTMLVDLQKRLFGVSYNASLFLWEVLKEARPRITSSKAGLICNDMWAAVDLGQPYNTTTRRERDSELPSRSVMALCETRKHSYASIQYSKSQQSLKEDAERAFEIFKYQSFLRSGPSYADKLAELLGVSDPPMSEAMFCGKGKLVWKYSY